MRTLIGCRSFALAQRSSASHDPGMVGQGSSEGKEIRPCPGEWR
jgi:hypothetical protein